MFKWLSPFIFVRPTIVVTKRKLSIVTKYFWWDLYKKTQNKAMSERHFPISVNIFTVIHVAAKVKLVSTNQKHAEYK